MAAELAGPAARGPALRLGMVAGEASGDLLAGLLLDGLASRWPGLSAAGIGGPRLEAIGFDAWWPAHKLSVFGFVDALRHYPELSGIRRRLGDRLIAERPTLFVGVDAPDFNFGLEKRLREAGLKTVHFVCPSIWAWRGGRVKTMKAAADHVLCLFPFEPGLLRAHGIAATFVGHPLASLIPLEPPRETARLALGLGASDPVVALLPSSRRSEIRYVGPRMLAAAALMRRERADLRFVLPVAPGLRELLAPLIAEHAPDVGIELVEGRSHEVLAACDVTLAASGTATLEAALFKRPMVMTYVVSTLNAMLMRRMRYQPWLALPNILCREFVVPELLQEDATPQALARATMAWLDDAPRCEAVGRRFRELHHLLRRDTARESADAIAQVLEA